MIVRKRRLDSPQGTENRTDKYGTFDVLRYSQVGGLTQFGAYVQTLQPGARSSDRHWHEGEDEFLYVISGEATVIEDDGPHVLLPGDAACWPAGTAIAHHVFNRSKAPCSYLIVGTRAWRDVVHYPDSGEILYNEEDEQRVIRWRLVRTDGRTLKSGTYSYASGSTVDDA
jgi:uncharacterized cupin superfamily protein